MPFVSIDSEEFATALTKFNISPGLVELKASSDKSLSHDFIKVGRHVLGLNPTTKSGYKDKTVFLGRGTYGEVKYAIDRANEQYAVKIQYQDEDLMTNAGEVFWLTNDLNIANCYQYRNKFEGDAVAYTVMPLLGQSLDKYLELNKSVLSDSQKLTVAAKMCYQLYKLHEGLASKTGEPIHHLDIKPSNFTIDDYGRVKLLDFDLSVTEAQKPKDILYGTHYYLPFSPEDYNLLDVDTIALMRSIHFPRRVVIYKDAEEGCDLFNPGLADVLSVTMLAKYGLVGLFDTSKISISVPSPMALMTRLALLSGVDTQSFATRIFDLIESEAIAYLLHANCLTRTNLEALLADPQRISLLSSMASIIDFFPAELLATALSDDFLMDKLQHLAQISPLKQVEYCRTFSKQYERSPENLRALYKLSLFPTEAQALQQLQLAKKFRSATDRINAGELLHLCAIYNFVDDFDWCIQAGADINLQDKDGYTALMYVVQGNHVRNFNRLMSEPGVDVCSQQLDGFTALDYAEGSLYQEQVGFINKLKSQKLYNLLEKAKLSDAPGVFLDEHNILFEALKCGEIESFKQAIAWGANINLQDNASNSLLMKAIKSKQPEFVDLLLCQEQLELGSIAKLKVEAVLKLSYEYTRKIQFLSDVKFSLTRGELGLSQLQSMDALHFAISYQMNYLIDELISAGVSVNSNATTFDGDTPLMCAVRHNNSYAVEQLLASNDIRYDLRNSQREGVSSLLQSANLPMALKRELSCKLQAQSEEKAGQRAHMLFPAPRENASYKRRYEEMVRGETIKEEQAYRPAI